MITEYTHRLTLAVPEALIPQANNLALIMGASVNDINTFKNANWQDESGNLYAVCSASSKPVILDSLSNGLPETLPPHAESADVVLAQEALDSIVIYTEGVNASVDNITLAIDNNPLTALGDMGLSLLPVP